MSSCLTCRHARKPKSLPGGFVVCVLDGSAELISHVCMFWESLAGLGNEYPSVAEGHSSPFPYNSRGTRDNLSFTDDFISRCETQNSL